MADMFDTFTSSLESPATHLFEVIPDDVLDLAQASRALNVATDGTVRLTTVGGTTATVYISAGSTFPVRVTRVWQTGTSATGIVALY